MSKAVKILSLTALALAFSASVGAATLKIATLAPAGTTWMKEMKAGATRVKERTEGRVKFKFYPGGVMGNDRSVHRKIKIGQLQGGTFTPGGLGQVNSVIYALGLPMMFQSYAEVDYVRTRMDPVIKQTMEDSGMVILGISEGGFARIMSGKAMRDLESIRATKVWIPEGDPLAQITYNALGINPIALPISDVFTGLQTGLIETVAVNPTAAIAFQWHTSVSYLTETPITYLIGVMAVQKKAFDKLSAGDQGIVREEIGEAFKRLDVLNRKDNQAAKEALREQGIVFVKPDPDEEARWKSIADAATEEMAATGTVPPEIVSQVREHLQNFRASQ